MEFKTLIYRPGPVARVILNRPEKLNAQNWTMLQEMERAFDLAVDDPECRVIVLSGEGRAFSAGHDLTSDDQHADVTQQARHLESYNRGLLSRDVYTESHLRWRDLPKPTIAMVHGQCIYGGWMIASAMDFIFAADDAMFIPTYGDYFTMPFDLGPRKAKELLFANRFMTAEEGERWGFFSRIVAPEHVLAQAQLLARQISEGPTFANTMTKRMLAMEWAMSVEEAIEAEAVAQALCMTTADFARAFEAFSNKVKPVFQGN